MQPYDLDRLGRFGEQVERWLLEAGWSQTQLAKACDLSTTVISRLVRTKRLRQAGKYVSYPNTSTVHKILDALSGQLGPNIKKQGFQILRTEAPPQVNRRQLTVNRADKPGKSSTQGSLPFDLPPTSVGEDDSDELLRMIRQLPRETRTYLQGLLEGLQKGEARAAEVAGAHPQA